MRKGLLLCFLIVCPVLCAGADDRHFSLGVGPSIDNYGYTDDSGVFCTDYAGFDLSADWLFREKWGLRLGFGPGVAFGSNVTGTWEQPLHSIFNMNLNLVPYYEFVYGKCFADFGAVIGTRVRLPFLNTSESTYLMTLSVGLGADIRLGYEISDKWRLYAGFGARRTVYDVLGNVFYYGSPSLSGSIFSGFGIIYRFPVK